jgi:hypothetical protein
MKKINTLRGQKVENKPSEPKNGIWASKSVWLFLIPHRSEILYEAGKIYFWGSKR